LRSISHFGTLQFSSSQPNFAALWHRLALPAGIAHALLQRSGADFAGMVTALSPGALHGMASLSAQPRPPGRDSLNLEQYRQCRWFRDSWMVAPIIDADRPRAKENGRLPVRWLCRWQISGNRNLA
jgi:hypothetical protein